MIVAIPVAGSALSAEMDPRFGRAEQFLLVDTETDQMRVLANNQNLNAPQGAGIQAAKAVLDAGAEAVLSRHVGPKAFATLTAGGATVYTGISGTADDALQQLRSGQLNPSQGADVDGHWA
jgi:predicted Fe-Mo cluster-binding NifX family protein